MLVLSSAAVSLLVCVAAAWAEPASGTASQVLHSRADASSVQAAFQIPCHGCNGGVYDDALSFHFEALRASQPCGQSALKLNDLDITTGPHSTHSNGSATVLIPDSKPDGHWTRELELSWELNCLSDSTSPTGLAAVDSALVLTVTVSRLGGITPSSPSGFTTSFKQYPEFEILRFDVSPTSPAPFSPAEDWRDPPPSLRLGSLAHEADISRIIDKHLQELAALKAQKKELKKLIEAKEKQLKAELEAHGEDFPYDFSDCDSLDCAFKAISQRVETAFKDVYYRLTSERWDQAALGGQGDPTSSADTGMHPDASNPPESVNSPIRYPPSALLPWPDESEASTYGSYEKLPDDAPPPRPFPQDSRRRRSPIVAVLHFILVAFGLIALAGFVRRRCASLRTRTERAANREERRNRRAYRRAARRAAWKNWWRSGWGRRKDQERRLDYEEKRALIQQQESRLEGAMQDEILNLRHAHGVVDELVRAEEGRGTLARPIIIRGRMPGMASIAGVMMGQDVYSSSHLSGSTAVSEETDDGSVVHTPPTSANLSRSMSRSNSLPSYRTDPAQTSAPSSRFGDSEIDNRSLFSDPPAYQTDPEDSDDEAHGGAMGDHIVTDGFRQYAPSEYAHSLLSPTDTASIFTPESSIPDLSPRESAETVRTFM